MSNLGSFNRFILFGLALLGLSISSANAVVVGDKDWYQVNDLTSNSWNDFDAIFDSTTGVCDVVGCLLGGSIDLTGYTWASNADVNTLIAGYYAGPGLDGSNATTVVVNTGPASLDRVFADFDPTDTSSTSQYLDGFTRESSGVGFGTFISILNVTDPTVADAVARFVDLPAFRSYPTLGGYVYRNVSAVPLPAAVWLFGTAMVGLIGFGRRRPSGTD